jgi:Ser/Thr protein kinase RdoA (MazF antagonist)
MTNSAPTVMPNADDVLQLLATAWGLNADWIVAIDRGTANCRIIGAGEKWYFLKEFQQGASQAEVSREMSIVDHLRRDGVPVGHVVPTLTRESATVYRNRIFQLQFFIAGQVYQKFAAPNWLSRELPRTLAAIVRSLKRYPQLSAGHLSWFTRNLHERASLFTEFALQLKSAAWLTGEQRLRITENAIRRADLIRTLARGSRPDGPFTLANSHGDYSVLQIICGDRSIRAVVDFARASYLPIAWEIFRSFTYLDSECRNGGIAPKALQAYVAEYDELVPLSDHDKAQMVDLYIYQLAPSTYGFRQVLEGKLADTEAFIAFSCWRTDMCETLITRRDELVEALLQ